MGRRRGRVLPRPRQPVGRGGADYHNPTGGIGGAAPAHSALTLRAVLAGFGLLLCAGGAIGLAVTGGGLPYVFGLSVLALIAAVDLLVIFRRKRRGEPG